MTRPSSVTNTFSGLDIPVHDPRRTRRREAVGDLHRVLDGLASRERTGSEALSQRLALEELEDDVGSALVHAGVENRQEIAVPRAPAALLSCSKRFQVVGIGGRFRGQDLDRHLSSEA